MSLTPNEKLPIEMMSDREKFDLLPPERRLKILEGLTDEQIARLQYDWNWLARPKQLSPDHPKSTAVICDCDHCIDEEIRKNRHFEDLKAGKKANSPYVYIPCPTKLNWLTWIVLAGRGFGKTRVGAEWVRELVEKKLAGRIAIIAPTSADARDVVVEGESGIMSICPNWDRPTYEPTKRRLTWNNGAIATLYSSQEPDRLRGPQHDAAWVDEVAGFELGSQQETWDMLQFGLRLGKNPRCLVTTTPKPTVLIQNFVDMAKDPVNRLVITTGSSYENRSNLAAPFMRQIAQYEGTNLGRQEIHAELIDIEESGIVKRQWIKRWPAKDPLPFLEYVIQSYDTAFTDKTQNDPTACSVYGIFRPTESSPHCVILLDAWREYLKYPELRVRCKEDYKAKYGDARAPVDIVLIEEKGSGIPLIQDLQRAGVYVRPYNPGKPDKVMRLHSVSHLAYNGRVYIPESRKVPGEFVSWAEEFVRELCGFPNSPNDDYVDTFSQAMALLRDQDWVYVDSRHNSDDDEEDYPKKRRATENPYAM